MHDEHPGISVCPFFDLSFGFLFSLLLQQRPGLPADRRGEKDPEYVSEREADEQQHRDRERFSELRPERGRGHCSCREYCM